MRTCQICKQALPLQERGRKRSYCSRKCKFKAYRRRKQAARPKPKRKRPVFPAPGQATCLGCAYPLVSAHRGRKRRYCSSTCRKKAYRTRQKRLRETYRQAVQNSLFRLMHKSVEWYTPPEYIQAVSEVLGTIELDPASNAVANQTIQAQRFFDRETNGLEQRWEARTVYLNPPHDHINTTAPWIKKLLAEYQSGNLAEAIVLVDASTETRWFDALCQFPFCLVQGRINFLNGEGQAVVRPINGSAFVYLGKQPDKFCRVFQKYGNIFSRGKN